ncbi:hypothetical protein OsJ_22163 [Oryza sativa Japonica Group]|uniref:Uncharacterized protein n=1 Tax=Oryza sativa subsp. japonica TaxID=39947 RepID=B9FQ80_ORYSJ|nr:hypothetical protein OsJ_22163 [Oryza sativa Japonica Group]
MRNEAGLAPAPLLIGGGRLGFPLFGGQSPAASRTPCGIGLEATALAAADVAAPAAVEDGDLMITKACLLLDIQGGHLMPKYLDQLLQNVGNMEWNVRVWMRGDDDQPFLTSMPLKNQGS